MESINNSIKANQNIKERRSTSRCIVILLHGRIPSSSDCTRYFRICIHENDMKMLCERALATRNRWGSRRVSRGRYKTLGRKSEADFMQSVVERHEVESYHTDRMNALSLLSEYKRHGTGANACYFKNTSRIRRYKKNNGRN